MTTKERIITESIQQILKELEEINNILASTPLSTIYSIRKEAQELLEQCKTIEQRTSNDFLLKIEDLSNREKEQFILSEKLKDSSKLIENKVKLEMELQDLHNELYRMRRNIQ